ncbi:MAG: DNA-directed RNA polymerase subunit H [Nitrososphaerota archaeon]|jgi:DNA-directed RNA polymerase subunit H|nr:DNA-directed RNA polymerase subunit H [Nitrososphaerota archaeon]MDG6967164.1 DNA-directed RNA polymerase subunit H [Nitrososphaerota archaeon]MDG6968735.1 DNA-directed RNA polymerase subunit H [Nitrososphaerota archaeon]MDG6978799.1 DNA-directed RNA polymerase subunit H [Nitrososphaerota archaeon]
MPAKAKTTRAKKEEELPFKITDHMLVPKHELLPPDEAQATLKRFNAAPHEFPFVLSTDPAAKSIGAKAGDFVRVTRASETAGETVYYRYVVEA